MKKEQKTTIVQDLEKSFQAHDTYYLVDYKRLTVAQAVELRKLLRKNGFAYKVVKNRLALRALEGRCPGELAPFFRKSTGVAFGGSDPILLAKLLQEFSAGGKVLSVKAGVVEGMYMAPPRFDEVVKLGSKNDLRARLAGMMASPLRRFLAALQSPLTHTGLLMGQLKDKKTA